MKINKIIDHTNIQKNAKKNDIIKTCKEAREYGFRGVCVRPKWIGLVKQKLGETSIKVICLVDPPIGDSFHQERVRICKKAKKDGTDELDVVISIPDLKHERWGRVLNYLKEICKILPTKVIIGSGYLTDEEIIKASQISKKAGAICVKTATEKDPLEHRELKEKFFHLKLMRKGAPGLLIKVAGSIKNLRDAKGAIKAGADIIGSSYGVSIIKEIQSKSFKKRYNREE
jgi:deoxyribose-phosphate aldolase